MYFNFHCQNRTDLLDDLLAPSLSCPDFILKSCGLIETFLTFIHIPRTFGDRSVGVVINHMLASVGLRYPLNYSFRPGDQSARRPFSIGSIELKDLIVQIT